MFKSEVRNLARKIGLDVADKGESQDFIAGGNYISLFDRKHESGDIVDEYGRFLGKHTGLINFTVGQRKGINVGSISQLFVKDQSLQFY